MNYHIGRKRKREEGDEDEPATHKRAKTDEKESESESKQNEQVFVISFLTSLYRKVMVIKVQISITTTNIT